MDALDRRLFAFALVVVASLGCDDFAWHRNAVRGQMPDGPVAPSKPLTLPPSAPPVGPGPAVAPSAPAKPVIELAGLGQPQIQTQVKVVATVAGELIITEDEVLMMMKERAGDFMNLTGEERERKERQVYREELRKLIERELILHDFTVKIRKNKPTALDEVWEQARQSADRQIREFRKMAKLESEEMFTGYLRYRGTDMKMFRRFFERTACMSIFLGSLLKESNRGIPIVQIEDYYRSNPEEFKVPDRAKWQHLFVSTSRFATPADAKLYADWLQKSVKEGRDVAALAKQYGHGDSALRNGEGIGEKAGEIRPAELEAPLFALKAGQVSELIPDANGFHILKVLERDFAGIKPLDDKLQQTIRAKLTDRAMKAERERIVTELWRKHTVVIAD
jgi:parvulin-like peptidyl-prolyl isomerase